MTWYDGGLLPPKPVEMGEEMLNPVGGALVIGSKGKLMHDTYGCQAAPAAEVAARIGRDTGRERWRASRRATR